jgi:hypothetical protein
MLITTEALYFGGQTKTLRIPLRHVLRYQSYVDGVGVCESHGPPQSFCAGLQWHGHGMVLL